MKTKKISKLSLNLLITVLHEKNLHNKFHSLNAFINNIILFFCIHQLILYSLKKKELVTSARTFLTRLPRRGSLGFRYSALTQFITLFPMYIKHQN